MALLHAPPVGGDGAAEVAGPRLIAEGDLVIVYERHDSMKPVHVTAKGRYDNRFAHFKMQEWIGLPFGSRVTGSGGGWVLLLAPTPELWSLVLRHRTQILYVADISMIVTFMELRPGCVVLESGTGSGSLTTSLARAIAPSGHVHTFEYHAQRAEAAAEEFASNGLSSVITTQQRDIEALGFPEALAGLADGVFLDLPGPHKVVASAAASLRIDGVFVSFSPCIEQIQKTSEALVNNGFVGLRTFECLLHYYELHTERLITDLDSVPDEREGGKGGHNKRRRDGSAPAAAAEAGKKAPVSEPQTVAVAKPCMEARGHTGYLLVARKAVPC